MKNMRRLVAVMLMLTLALCLVACGGTQDSTPATTTTQKQEPSSTQSTPPASSSTTAPRTPSFTVLVLDQDGNPVANVPVQLCGDTGCYGPFATNSDGVAEFFDLDGLQDPHARIFQKSNGEIPGAPGYQVDVMDGMDEEGYLDFVAGQTTLTLTITLVAG